MRKTGKHTLAALVTIGLVTACSPHRYVDDDDTCSRAKPLPPIVLVKDELDVNMGDRSDCKQVKYFKDAVARVEYRVGTAFEKGLITVYDSDGQVIDQKAVDPSVFKYDFEFDVVQQKPFYVEFKATAGGHPYQAQVRFEKKDPCAKCGPDQECVDAVGGGKECRTPEVTCNPPCDPDEGQICSEEGQCVDACNPRCRRGYRCDVDTQECVRLTGRSNPRCRRGKVCRRGRCVNRPQPNICKGGCPPGQVCRAGKCTGIGPGDKCPACPNPTDVCNANTNFKCVRNGPDVPTGPIVGRLASSVRSGNGAVLYLNRGKQHGVKRGQKGKLCGKYRFIVTNAFATRSKATTNHTLEEIGDCKNIIIKR